MEIASRLKKFLPLIAGVFFPSGCNLCGKPLHPSQKCLCSPCSSRIQILESPQCKVCGAEIPRFQKENKCPECRRQTRFFSQGSSRLKYNQALSRLIQKVKYEKRFHLWDYLMETHQEWKPFEEEIDTVTSIPMTYTEKFKRETNLSELLAKKLAKEMTLPYCRFLKKVRNTPPQSRLSRKERLTNLTDAFQPQKKNKIQGKNILLVDDIFTTGTTLKEAAFCLKSAGAKRVLVASLARAGHYENS
jgi:ComF family protein